MGIGGISIWQLLIVLAIVLLLFGTKKLKNMGGDLGGAVKGFKNAMKDAQNAAKDEDPEKLEKADQAENIIEGEATKEETTKEKS